MSTTTLSGIAPENVWRFFEEISQIPRCSQNEDQIRAYLTNFAETRSLQHIQDTAGNIIIKKPATPGNEHTRGVILQGHMDMVCEQNSHVKHDFSKDPIKLVKDGPWLKADGTTLGADNGIALAIALAVLDSDTIEHGPLEALFTTDEESGLTGAMELDPAVLDGRILMNMDSEEEGVFCIGCAGGVTTSGWCPIEWSPTPAGYVYYKLSVTGLKGGHSGGDIHENRGNAIKFAVRILWNLLEKVDVRIAGLDGGGKHNAIPRECFVTFVAPANQQEKTLQIIDDIRNNIAAEYQDIEPELHISLEHEETAPEKVLSPKATFKAVNCVFMMPHGVDEMSRTIPGMVETSTNLASVNLQDYEVQIITSQRSSSASKRDNMANRITAILRCPGARVSYSALYPAWTPDPENPLIDVFKSIYRKLNNSDPEFTAIHAGLECGVIGDKFPDMTMISFGPDLQEVHTPNEQLSIPSVERTWKMLIEALKSITE
ncbi:MAG: aminoacyl-histidine dipeptidase [Spirochaetia bacterium]